MWKSSTGKPSLSLYEIRGLWLQQEAHTELSIDISLNHKKNIPRRAHSAAHRNRDDTEKISMAPKQGWHKFVEYSYYVRKESNNEMKAVQRWQRCGLYTRFETEVHRTQAGLEFAMKPRLALNSWCPHPHLSSPGITGLHYCIWFTLSFSLSSSSLPPYLPAPSHRLA